MTKIHIGQRSAIIAYVLILSFCGLSFARRGKNLSAHPLSEREVNLTMIYKVSVDGHINDMTLKMVIPDNIKDRQTVNDISFSIQPDSIYKINSNTYALFRFYDIDKSFKLTVSSKITIYRVIGTKADTAQTDFSKYLVAEKDIETGSPKIVAAAAKLKQRTDIETVMNTFEYVKNTVTYELNPPIGAEKVLESGVGKCMDFSDLFVALLRANNIPAKSMFGIVVDYSGTNPLHAWPEVYLKKQGWVRFDPTSGHSEITKVGNDYTMKIKNKYIVLSEGRNDPELHVYQYHYFYHCSSGTQVKVKSSYDIDAFDDNYQP